jgi:hypothetical protein
MDSVYTLSSSTESWSETEKTDPHHLALFLEIYNTPALFVRYLRSAARFVHHETSHDIRHATFSEP